MAVPEFRSIFRLHAVDRLGKEIDPTVLEAAEEIYQRAVDHGVKLLGDPALVVNELEQVAAAVSRVLRTRRSSGGKARICNLPGYLFRAFVRKMNRLRRQQLVVVSLSEADRIPGWSDPSRQFEMKMLLDECLAQCDFIEQDMAWRRIEGFSWEEIGRMHGLSAHAAEARFSDAVKRARVKLKI